MTTRTLVLDEDGLDLLELALSDAIPRLPLPATAATVEGDLVLTDGENTPLARLRALGSLPATEALQPFARHGGPHWDPQLRITPAASRERLGSVAAGRPVLGLVIDDVPTRGDLDRAAAAVDAAGAGAVLVALPVSRRPRAPGAVGWAGMTRAGIAFAEALRSVRPGTGVVIVVVPWPAPEGNPQPPIDIEAVLRAYGAPGVVRLSGMRSPAERDRIASLAGVRASAVRDVYPEASAVEVLRTSSGTPRRGAVILFTGLSGSGKSTIARALAEDLADTGPRGVTLLDGDEVRQHLSAELGFDVTSRERNVERIGWVAAEVARHGGVALAAPIAPFAGSRARVRALAEAHGTFLLVWVSTPLDVCEARDRKGLYARARAGAVADFTGISSPYEEPDDADLVVDTTATSVEQAVASIRALLEERLGD